MSKVVEARCGNCAAWIEMAVQGPVEIGAPKRGVCHMFPPTPVPRYDRNGNINGQGHIRPVPMDNESCLHFVARDALPPAVAN
jgi:hypothetical protein